MKKIIYFAVIILHAVSANGQGMFINIDDATRTLTEEVSQKHMLNISNNEANDSPGGCVLPSVGTINVLMVFAQFPDDNYDINNPLWPAGKDPADMDKWVNQTWTKSPIQGSLTHYFNDMSFNKFKFTGKTISVVSPHTREWYLTNNWKRGDIQKEIILQINKTISFAEFDNWKYVGDYYQINQPDGIIDMMIIIWRNIAKELPNESFIKSNLDFTKDCGNLGGQVFFVDNGTRRVNTGYFSPGTTASGITICSYLTDRNKTFRIAVHEIAHYLLGNNCYHNGFGFWGMLSSYGIKSIVANSFERSRLGWINLKNISSSTTQTISNATLSDYLTTGDSYCFEIDPNSGQYFYIENHQNISYWDTTVNLGNIEKGLYVIRKDSFTPTNEDDNPSSAFMRLISAEGRYDWAVNQVVSNPWGSVPSVLPVFKELKPDRKNGYDDLDYIPWNWNSLSQSPIPIYFTEDQNGKAQLDVRYTGDGKDAFRVGYNEVFSPWSNPNSYKADRTPTPFGFKINSLVDGVYSIDIFVNNSIEAPPSKPIGLNISADLVNHSVKLIWENNIEPDLSFYEISRKISKDGDYWKVIGTTKNNLFIDDSIFYSPFEGLVTLNYRIRAKDVQDLYSVYSEAASIRIELNNKVTDASELNRDKGYRVYQNYPNPFNPTTTIKYQISTSGIVSLKVYDILGREVAILVNEEKPAGSYEVVFTASSLASGIYFYKLQTGLFVETKKMILLK